MAGWTSKLSPKDPCTVFSFALAKGVIVIRSPVFASLGLWSGLSPVLLRVIGPFDPSSDGGVSYPLVHARLYQPTEVCGSSCVQHPFVRCQDRSATPTAEASSSLRTRYALCRVFTPCLWLFGSYLQYGTHLAARPSGLISRERHAAPNAPIDVLTITGI